MLATVLTSQVLDRHYQVCRGPCTCVRLWNSIPKELRIKNRTPFKRELKNRLLKLLENEEMNVDIRCSEICKYLLIK